MRASTRKLLDELSCLLEKPSEVSLAEQVIEAELIASVMVEMAVPERARPRAATVQAIRAQIEALRAEAEDATPEEWSARLDRVFRSAEELRCVPDGQKAAARQRLQQMVAEVRASGV